MSTEITTKPDSARDAPEKWELMLFVVGNNAATRRVKERVERICHEHLADQCRIEVVDIMLNPEQAYTFDIIATPTLLRQSPKPVQRVFGNLSETPMLLAGLGLLAEETGC